MIVFVLRHADRKPEPDDDLTPAGIERAKLLARMLAETGVSIAFRSEARRAARTLVPLKQRLGDALTIEEVRTDSAGGPVKHAQDIVASVQALPQGTVAVVVSHSNTVGSIIKDLGGELIGAIDDHEFDKLFVLFIDPAGSVTTLKMRYGAVT